MRTPLLLVLAACGRPPVTPAPLAIEADADTDSDTDTDTDTDSDSDADTDPVFLIQGQPGLTVGCTQTTLTIDWTDGSANQVVVLEILQDGQTVVTQTVALTGEPSALAFPNVAFPCTECSYTLAVQANSGTETSNLPVSITPDLDDADGDGATGCDGDCDDDYPEINPAADEVCNGIDDNCSGLIDDVASPFYSIDAGESLPNPLDVGMLTNNAVVEVCGVGTVSGTLTQAGVTIEGSGNGAGLTGSMVVSGPGVRLEGLDWQVPNGGPALQVQATGGVELHDVQLSCSILRDTAAVTSAGILSFFTGSLQGCESELASPIEIYDGLTTLGNPVFPGLYLTNNKGQHGGAVRQEGGDLLLDWVDIEDNESVGDGGGIAVMDGNVQFAQALIANNFAGGVGGGAYLAGVGDLIPIQGPTSFQENTADKGGGLYTLRAIEASNNVLVLQNTANAGGGGIWHGDAVDSTLSTSRVENNSTLSGGGGIHVDSGSLEVTNSTLVLANSTLGFGGGVHVDTGASFITSGLAMEDNTAARGGGLFVKGALDLNGWLLRNAATLGSGGGVYVDPSAPPPSITGTVFQHNHAAQDGGGMFLGTWAPNMGANFNQNHAASIVPADRTQPPFLRNDSGRGGGLFVFADEPMTLYVSATDNTARHGGALALVAGPGLSVKHTLFDGSSFNGNYALEHGGAIWANAGLATGEALFELNVADLDGGAVFAADTLEMATPTFTTNYANRGGGIFLASSAGPTVIQGTLSGNAAGAGGGLYVDGDSPVRLGGTWIANGTPGGSELGSAAHIATAPVCTVSDLLIEANEGDSALEVGGNVFLGTAQFRFNNTTTTVNHPGGGVLCSGATWEDNLLDVTFSTTTYPDPSMSTPNFACVAFACVEEVPCTTPVFTCPGD